MLTLKVILGPVYDAVAEQLESQLQPEGAIEVLLAAQIVRAHWRLERCEKANDPDHPDIDRIRHRAEISIRRNMAEIRQLQADRHLKAELNLDLPGITRVKDIIKTKIRTHLESAPVHVAQVESKIAAVMQKEQQIQTHLIGRNTICPCGSRLKHKRCCGKDAPPLYNFAA